MPNSQPSKLLHSIWKLTNIFRNSQEAYNFNLDRQLKYDVESIEIIIDRLFDVAN